MIKRKKINKLILGNCYVIRFIFLSILIYIMYTNIVIDINTDLFWEIYEYSRDYLELVRKRDYGKFE